MTDLLSIGAGGVRAYQTALTTTSENIANAGVAGYSRRSAALTEIGRTESVGLGQTVNLTGDGVTVRSIARASDEFRNSEVRRSSSDLARSETGVTWLGRIENAIDGNQLDDRLTAFFNAAKGVAADPAASAPRSVMLESASALANSFAGTGRAIDAATADLDGAGRDAATKLTSLSQSLMRVNRGLARTDNGSTGQAQLLDERDRLLEGMSALTDTNISFDSIGRATVRAGGATGPVLASPESAGTVTFAMNASGATSFAVNHEGTVSAISSSGGALAGLAESAQRLANARETLDTMAQSFVDGVNAVQAGGRDLAGNPGGAMFATGGSPTDITMVLTDPRGIAAAAPGEGTRGNGNMTDLATLRTTGAFETKLDDLATDNAASLSAKSSVAQAQSAIRDSAVASRDSVAGIDLDEEAVDLIRFQQAYQASSRVIQVARDTLNLIFDIR